MEFPGFDSRVAEWPFMRSATYVNLMIVAYLLFILLLGPAFMKNREPYKMRALLFFYNSGLVAVSAWMVYKFSIHGWLNKYHIVCEPTIPQVIDEDAMQVALAMYVFFASKIVELLDTVFFVLRKKYSQVTFLHVSHHALTLALSRYAVGHGAGGYNTTFAYLNSFVHVWMYLYYALSALGPGMQKYLWWKKYLTKLQLTQFVIIMVLMTANLLLPNCGTNVVLILLNMFPAIYFLVLFLDFYRKAYSKNRGTKGSGQLTTTNTKKSTA